MQYSITFKTSLIISFVLISVLSFIQWNINKSQNLLIKEMRIQQETYIKKQLNRTEKNSLKNEINSLKNLLEAIKGGISYSLYHTDKGSIDHSLLKLLHIDNIKAIGVFDTEMGEFFSLAYKNKDKKELAFELPKVYKDLSSLKVGLEENGEFLGNVILYYNNDKLIKSIASFKKKDLDVFEKQTKVLDKKIALELKKQMMIFILGGVFIVISIVLLLIFFVNKPLALFQEGLNSFFDYLKDSSKKVIPIAINSKDELGQMSRSVKKSIDVSITMHAELANLMALMDKHVITSDTDMKGIITHVSSAFCDISGYTKEELLGKKHSLVRHDDDQNTLFKEMWETILEEKIWHGEVKNFHKDGTFYWLDTVINPKYSRSGKLKGFTSVRFDITDKKNVEEFTFNLSKKIKVQTKEIEATHKHTRQSIEYASLIQSAVLPNHDLFTRYFKEYFAIWHPKDVVGGDIYLFNELRHKGECLIMFIDCTGHGVPGAFVTMLVKAVEVQIIAKIMNEPKLEVSPAWVLSYFNQVLKKLLKQDNADSISNAGFDGGIIYYNKKEKILKFAGAETSLFYIDTKGSLETVKGNRYSVGYKKCDANYEYKETLINVEEGMKFYCTTDGYFDQNGGDKGFPFGKKRFKNLIEEYHAEAMAEQQEFFLYELAQYEEMSGKPERNDDITLIAFTIDKTESLTDEKQLLEKKKKQSA